MWAIALLYGGLITNQGFTSSLKRENTLFESLQDSAAYLLKATEVNLLPELEIQAEVPPIFTHQWGTQTALLHRQVREHLKKDDNYIHAQIIISASLVVWLDQTKRGKMGNSMLNSDLKKDGGRQVVDT